MSAVMKQAGGGDTKAGSSSNDIEESSRSLQEVEMFGEEPLLTLNDSHSADDSVYQATTTTASSVDNKGCCCNLNIHEFLKTTAASVYASGFLSAWGDRMWQFSVGMYLNDLSPESLRLVAAYGFTMGGATLLTGAIIGDLVDRYPRLRVARIAMTGQNVLVAVCALLVCMVYVFKPTIYEEGFLWRSYLCEAGIIFLAIISNLFSIGHKISVDKDWLSVICEGKSSSLARMSSIMRAIDLLTNIIAPIGIGFIMTYGSMMISALFVAGWNIGSAFVEYSLLMRVYRLVPELASKNKSYGISNKEKTTPNDDVTASDVDELPDINTIKLSDEQHEELSPLNAKIEDQNEADDDKKSASANPEVKSRYGFLRKLLSAFIILKDGWMCYMSYDVRFAGIGLAMLYLTVLGFGNITVGFAYSQGASQAVLGGLMALGAIIGVLATFTYPRLRKKVGIEKTGLIGFSSEILALVFCIVSIWTPGSPFDLSISNQSDVTIFLNQTVGAENSTTLMVANDELPRNYLSLILLMTGIIAARFGLWTADLAVSQLLLERVPAEKRGTVNGVQASLNMLLDMVKFIIVIIMPKSNQFGILIIISFLAVCSGGLSYTVYSVNIRRKNLQSVIRTSCDPADR